MPYQTARTVLAKYWDRKLPVDPRAIAKALGVKVEAEFSLGGEASGMFRYKEGQPVVSYDMTESELRQRFTVAHELGHFVLGHGKNGAVYRDTADQFSLGMRSPEEIAANRFAAELLMPADAVKYCVQNKGMTSISKLAETFKVSQVAMRYRLQNLGFL